MSGKTGSSACPGLLATPVAEMGALGVLLLITAAKFNENIHMAAEPKWMVRVTDFSLNLAKLCLSDLCSDVASYNFRSYSLQGNH